MGQRPAARSYQTVQAGAGVAKMVAGDPSSSTPQWRRAEAGTSPIMRPPGRRLDAALAINSRCWQSSKCSITMQETTKSTSAAVGAARKYVIHQHQAPLSDFLRGTGCSGSRSCQNSKPYNPTPSSLPEQQACNFSAARPNLDEAIRWQLAQALLKIHQLQERARWQRSYEETCLSITESMT